MFRLEVDQHGRVLVLIADAAGAEHAYTIEPALPGLDRAALLLRRLDTDTTYRIGLTCGGRIRCNCPAATYRKRGAPECKHAGLIHLFKLCETLLTRCSREKK
jgi:hypothetical protein